MFSAILLLFVAVNGVVGKLAALATGAGGGNETSYRIKASVAATANIELSYVDCYFVLIGRVGSLNEANAACRAKSGGKAAIFRSTSEHHTVTAQLDWGSVPGIQGPDGWIAQLWTGLQRASNDDSFYWGNHSPIEGDLLRLATVEDDQAADNSSLNCVITRKDGLLVVPCQLNKTAGILCQITTYDMPNSFTSPPVDDPNFCKVYLLPSGPSVASSIVSVPGYVRKNFFTIEGQFTWSEAKEACELINLDIDGRNVTSSLAILSSLAEYQFLRSSSDFFTFTHDGYWIGLRRIPSDSIFFGYNDAKPSAFLWLDGSSLSYQPFLPNHPSKYGGIERCAAITKSPQGSLGVKDQRCLKPDKNGEIEGWADWLDSFYGALCQFGVEWF